jgi:hypothetical protein
MARRLVDLVRTERRCRAVGRLSINVGQGETGNPTVMRGLDRRTAAAAHTLTTLYITLYETLQTTVHAGG